MRWAANNGHLEVVKLLVISGADVYVNNNEALRCAANHGYLDVVKFLVDQGSDIHANNNEALHWAKENNYQKVVDYLKSFEKSKEVFNLKELNTNGRKTCAKCGGKLRMPIGLGNKYNYCPVCEG